MLFNSVEFVIFFILVLSVLIVIKYRNFQHLFLLFASYFFFYFSSNYLITLLIFTTVWDFYFGYLIHKTKDTKMKKAILIASLAGNLGLLGFFKYADFAITQFNFIGQQFDLGIQIPTLHLALPIAISFYTFHSITYTVSIYRKQMEPVKSFTEYAIFVAFFPQLVAGPILRAKEFLPQLREKIDNLQNATKLRLITIESANLRIGITLMAFGFVKKMLFADNIAPLANEIFQHVTNSESFSIILGAIAFGVQIYCDFSGYSDIALGAATIMGFKIPINFNKPYFATSPIDFWRRWHISLSTWLRDYLYVPLGGNRKSKIRTYFNLGAVMFLGGLWHGASWNFVVWGLLHGAYLAAQKSLGDRFPTIKNHIFFTTTLGKIVSIIVTQYVIFFTWLAFRINNIDAVFYSLYKYLIWDFEFNLTSTYVRNNPLAVSLIMVFFILSFISYKQKNLSERISKLKSVYWIAFLVWAVILILIFYGGNSSEFIYFKF